MKPEKLIANEFWLFVREQAIDKSTALYSRPVYPRLTTITWTNSVCAAASSPSREIDLRARMGELLPEDVSEVPWLFETLDDALSAFLVGLIVDEGTRVGYAVDHVLWLKVVISVVADVALNPDLVTLTPRMKVVEGEAVYGRHVIAVTPTWSWLDRSDFEFAVATYRRAFC